MSERSGQTKQHPWTLPQHPHASRKVKQRKGSNSALIRNVLFLIAAAVFLPILYIYQVLEVKHVTIPSTVHKSLKNFQQGVPARKERAKPTTIVQDVGSKGRDPSDIVLTAYLESPDTLNTKATPLPMRETSASNLKKVAFPKVTNCSSIMQDFPIDEYPLQDPFLPWIHDIVPTLDYTMIQLVAQNRRRCDTGEDEVQTMKFWEPQISLLQRVPVVATQFEQQGPDSETSYRLASSFQEATHNATRFQCRFHHGDTARTTLSIFPFDYEYITWRKV